MAYPSSMGWQLSSGEGSKLADAAFQNNYGAVLRDRVSSLALDEDADGLASLATACHRGVWGDLRARAATGMLGCAIVTPISMTLTPEAPNEDDTTPCSGRRRAP